MWRKGIAEYLGKRFENMAGGTTAGDIEVVDNRNAKPHLNEDGTLVAPKRWCFDSTKMALVNAVNTDHILVEYGTTRRVKLRTDRNKPLVTGYLDTERKRDGMCGPFQYFDREYETVDKAFEALWALREPSMVIGPYAPDDVLFEGEPTATELYAMERLIDDYEGDVHG